MYSVASAVIASFVALPKCLLSVCVCVHCSIRYYSVYVYLHTKPLNPPPGDLLLLWSLHAVGISINQAFLDADCHRWTTMPSMYTATAFIDEPYCSQPTNLIIPVGNSNCRPPIGASLSKPQLRQMAGRAIVLTLLLSACSSSLAASRAILQSDSGPDLWCTLFGLGCPSYDYTDYAGGPAIAGDDYYYGSDYAAPVASPGLLGAPASAPPVSAGRSTP